MSDRASCSFWPDAPHTLPEHDVPVPMQRPWHPASFTPHMRLTRCHLTFSVVQGFRTLCLLLITASLLQRCATSNSATARQCRRYSSATHTAMLAARPLSIARRMLPPSVVVAPREDLLARRVEVERVLKLHKQENKSRGVRQAGQAGTEGLRCPLKQPRQQVRERTMRFQGQPGAATAGARCRSQQRPRSATLNPKKIPTLNSPSPRSGVGPPPSGPPPAPRSSPWSRRGAGRGPRFRHRTDSSAP